MGFRVTDRNATFILGCSLLAGMIVLGIGSTLDVLDPKERTTSYKMLLWEVMWCQGAADCRPATEKELNQCPELIGRLDYLQEGLAGGISTAAAGCAASFIEWRSGVPHPKLARLAFLLGIGFVASTVVMWAVVIDIYNTIRCNVRPVVSHELGGIYPAVVISWFLGVGGVVSWMWGRSQALV